MLNRHRRFVLTLLLCTGCRSGSPLFDDLLGGGWHPQTTKLQDDAGAPMTAHDAGAAARPSAAPPPCVAPVTSEPLPARAATMTHNSGANETEVFTRDLFNLFRSHCGACHVDANRGGLQVNLSNFSQTVTQASLNAIVSDDAARYMPPSGPDAKAFSARAPGDPVVELATLLEQWLAAGSPPDRFILVDRSATTTQSPYQLAARVGMALSNLGSCIPPKQIIGKDTDRMVAMDKFFAAATQLPARLEDTDLASFDAEVLARQGVIAYAPAYPLWYDAAKQMRAVRVPRGQAITFDGVSPCITDGVPCDHFRIPANTRFYTTFLQRVIDDDGSVRYRKMETRVIVSRPDDPSDPLAPHPHSATHALFGTYVWNDAETEAVLLQDPLRNGKPWRDHLLTYVTDARAAKKITDSHPSNVLDALEQGGVTRTYAVPGSERCWHCHMGSDNASFVLGFIPVQVNRRPLGEGGVIDPAERDELGQLQRLIDYGVVKGLGSPADVRKLEDTQADRKPRNDYELQAQGYMLGNCAHCHNPNGYPLSIAPELDGLLDLRPSDEGGAFQFTLGRFSPRIRRGASQDQPLPYITPSVLDRIPTDTSSYDKKVVITPTVDGDGNPYDREDTIFAPWRSLLYRTVDAPFSYAEDSAIYPRMPMHTAGYDCRIRRIMGTWMASIPSLWKGRNDPTLDATTAQLYYSKGQPYEEITQDPAQPNSADWQRAQEEAATRVRLFQGSLRYKDCPEPAPDIVDPEVVRGYTIVPRPLREVLDNADGTRSSVNLRIPARPHFAVTDLTEPPGDWAPRRSDWKSVLVDRKPGSTASAYEAAAVELLQNVKITEAMKAFALTDVPFGLWQQKAACDFSKVKHASDYQAANGRPVWMDVPGSGVVDGTEPVYSIAPGAAVFLAICANCHGALADSQGRVVATIADMTGGDTRVSNLRDGLFGPTPDATHQAGANRAREFNIAAGGASGDEWAARYAVWMGLGGTQRIIPPAIQAVVGNSLVGGRRREGFAAPVNGGNMLTVAQVLCSSVLPGSTWDLDVSTGKIAASSSPAHHTPPALIPENGDFELWQNLCVLDNPLPVRVVSMAPGLQVDQISNALQIHSTTYTDPVTGNAYDDIGLFRRAGYPAGYPVGDDQGQILPSLTSDVRAPWCFKKPSNAADLATAQEIIKQFPHGNQAIPFCPDELFAQQAGRPVHQLTRDDVERWTMRGAMNAGLAVFLYLDAREKGVKPPLVAYNSCEAVTTKP